MFDNGQKHAYDLFRSASSGSESALEDLRTRANSGDRWAAMQFGYLHHTGRAPKVGKDIKIAMKAYRKACRLSSDSDSITGNALAANNMGVIYLYGDEGVEIDAAEGAKWFFAGAGDEVHVLVNAAMNLANLYEHGFGNISQDLTEAGKWYRAAAARREPYALYKLGTMLVNGIGMHANQFEGQIKLSAAADLWSRDAMFVLSQMASNSNSLIDKNPVEAAKWLLIASEGDSRYKRLALDAMKAVPKEKTEMVRIAAVTWIKNHTHVPAQIDYRLPINIEPSDS